MCGFFRSVACWTHLRGSGEPRTGCQANNGVPFGFDGSACFSRRIVDRLGRSRTARIAALSFSSASLGSGVPSLLRQATTPSGRTSSAPASSTSQTRCHSTWSASCYACSEPEINVSIPWLDPTSNVRVGSRRDLFNGERDTAAVGLAPKLFRI